MIIFWFCVCITVGAAILATFMNNVRRASLALWVVGLGVGGLYLSMGAELLAIVQWIVSTLMAISFIFYSVMFGEYRASDPRTYMKKMTIWIPTVVLGCAFMGVISMGARHLSSWSDGVFVGSSDIALLGKTLIEDHLLALEILALTLFLVLVGAGAVARAEDSDL